MDSGQRIIFYEMIHHYVFSLSKKNIVVSVLQAGTEDGAKAQWQEEQKDTQNSPLLEKPEDWNVQCSTLSTKYNEFLKSKESNAGSKRVV